MLGMCTSPTHSAVVQDLSPPLGHLWRLNILSCKIRFPVPNSCGKQPSSAPLCFSTVALFLTGFNHPIIKSDTALTPYHCNLINFWSHKSFLYIKYVVSMGWISYLLHRDTQQHQLCANAVEKENKAAPEEDIEGLSSFPPANLKTSADGQQRLNCLWMPLRAPQKTAPPTEIWGKQEDTWDCCVFCYLFPYFSGCRAFSKADTDSDFGDLQHGVVTHLTARCVPVLVLFSLNQDGTWVTPLERHTSNRILRSNIWVTS